MTCADMLTSKNAGLYVSSLVDRLAGIRKHGHDPSYTTQKNLALAFDPYSADMYNCDTRYFPSKCVSIYRVNKNL